MVILVLGKAFVCIDFYKRSIRFAIMLVYIQFKLFYTTVQTPPVGTVTTTPGAIVIGPKLPAFIPTGIE